MAHDKKFDIFISYSRKDSAEVLGIVDMLKQRIPTISIWFDIDGIESGDEFEEKIITAIDNSFCVLFALSDNSIASPWTKKEVTYAYNIDTKVIPIMLQGGKMKGWFLFQFGRVDFIDSTSQQQLEKLVKNLAAWTGKPTSDEAAEGSAELSAEALAKAKQDALPRGAFEVGNLEYMGSETGGVTVVKCVTKLLEDIHIPAQIEYNGYTYDVDCIGDYAFSRCAILANITIPNSIKKIGDSVFDGCISLTTITIPDSVTEIGENVFADCSELTSITLSKNVKSIGTHAFQYCESLASIIIPHGVTSIGEWAFIECRSLREITLPDSVEVIGEGAFKSCYSLSTITLPNTITRIEDHLFSGCVSLVKITLPNSVTSIGKKAFSGCHDLTSIIIPDSVTSIEEGAFADCSNLTSVVIPTTTRIAANAFPEHTQIIRK